MKNSEKRRPRVALGLFSAMLAIAAMTECGLSFHASAAESASARFATPSVSCTPDPASLVTGANTVISARAVSPLGLPLTYSYKATAGTLKIQGSSATLNTNNVVGQVRVTCKATDSKGNAGSGTTNVQVAPAAPPIVSLKVKSTQVLAGATDSVIATASSPESRPLTYAWSTSAGSINAGGNNATLNTTGAVAGTITIHCTVTDNHGLAASAKITVTVLTPAPPSLSLKASLPQVTAGATDSILATASSPQGSSLTYKWSASAGSVTTAGNSATLSTTGLSAAILTIGCTVTDSQGLSATATTVVTVVAPGPPTLNLKASSPQVTVGTSDSFMATASSPEGRSLTYNWSTSAGSLSASGNSATLNTAGVTTGTLSINCTVTDSQGLSASAKVAVAVLASGIEPGQCAKPALSQPAPISSIPITPVLPPATTINVLLNGVAGDGQTNDSPAIQSIIDKNPNAVIYFPLANYKIDNPSLYQAGLLFSGFHGTAVMANGARLLCDNPTTSAGQCIEVLNSSGAVFNNFRIGYTNEQNLPLSRNDAISNAMLVENSASIIFNNTTVEASTGSGIWVTDSTGIQFLNGTSISSTAADGLHFENVGGAVVAGFTSQNTGDDGLSATNISTTTPNCGLTATNIQIYRSASRGIAVAGACNSSFANFYIQDTANSGIGIGRDPTINSLIPNNSKVSNGTVVNAGQYPSVIDSLKDCIDISQSSNTAITNVVCSNPMMDGLYVFDGADQVTVSGVSIDGAANVGFQVVDSTNYTLTNTVTRNSANPGYSIQQAQNGTISSALTCSSGGYGFYHSGTTNLKESKLMSYNAAGNNSLHRVWWAENNSDAISVDGFGVLDDQTHTAPDVIGGYADPAGSITVDGITQSLPYTTLSLQLP